MDYIADLVSFYVYQVYLIQDYGFLSIFFRYLTLLSLQHVLFFPTIVGNILFAVTVVTFSFFYLSLLYSVWLVLYARLSRLVMLAGPGPSPLGLGLGLARVTKP